MHNVSLSELCRVFLDAGQAFSADLEDPAAAWPCVERSSLASGAVSVQKLLLVDREIYEDYKFSCFT